jgi:hypothetical protein
MEPTTTLISRPPIKRATWRWVAWLRAAWNKLTLDADERFLGEAHDFADLEWRLQRLERGRPDRYGPLDPGA